MTELIFAIILILLIFGDKFFNVFRAPEKYKKEGECKNNLNPICLFSMVFESWDGLQIYCLNEEGRKKLREGAIWLLAISLSIFVVPSVFLSDYEASIIMTFLFVYCVIVISDGFRRYYIITKMADAGFENSVIDKFNKNYCKRKIIWILIFTVIFILLLFLILGGYFIDRNALQWFSHDYYRYGKKISFINKGNKRELMRIMNVKNLKNERFKELINSVHYIKDKYVYAPLFSMFMKKTDKRKDEDTEDVVKRVFLRIRYGWGIMILSWILKFLVLFIPYYFLIYRKNVRFYEKESKKIFKKTGKREILRSAEKMKKYEKSMIIFVIIFMFLSTRHNSAGCWRTADVLLRVHYSIITGKKLSSLSDKIEKLNIKTDKQLSEAIKKGMIKTDSVLDSTLTIQIEDSRLDENIKKELLNYYRDNYEKYRYRIINGYLIDFIHGKYRRLKIKK